MFKNKFPFFNYRPVLWILVLWQLVSVYLMSVGVWPYFVVYINVALSVAFILTEKPFRGLLFFIASAPFFVALPNAVADSFPTWRILVVALAGRWLIAEMRAANLPFKTAITDHRLIKFLKEKTIDNFFGWEKYLGLFILVATLSLFLARYKIQGFKQIVFLLNVYLLYIVIVYVVRTRSQLLKVIKYTAFSLGIIVSLGYIQFIATFFTTNFYFWQYWALKISRLYYGQQLSDVLSYSNSWFSYPDRNLRMFSIMPDSHSFAMIAVLLIAYLIPLLYIYESHTRLRLNFASMNRHKVTYGLWSAIRFSGLAVIFSGTRGVWVGLLPPLALSISLYLKKIGRAQMSKIVLSMLMIVAFFIASPLINKGLNLMRVSQFQENFLDRVETIYDLNESSNLGRLNIWKESIIFASSHPLGVGFGNFIVSLTSNDSKNEKFVDIAAQKNPRYNLPQKFVSAHSLYLNILVELGLIGVVVFLAFWLQYFATVYKFFKKYMNEHTGLALFVINMAFTFLWFLVYGLFDVTLFNDKVLIYTLISLALSGIIIRNYHSLENKEK